MSIIDSFDPDRHAVIDPETIHHLRQRKLDVCIINFSYKIMDALLEDGLLELVEAEAIRYISVHINVYAFKGTNIGVVQTQVGAPFTVGMIEDMATKFGSTKFVLFGSCGGLDRALTYGKLVVPSHAYRDEGTSYHYLPPADYVEIPGYPTVCRVLDRLRIPYVTGRSWTTDAFFRETRRNMERRKAEGCIAVEMELAACQAVADFRGYALYNFLYSADNLDHDQWDEGILSKIGMDERLRHFFIALEIAKEISGG
ncbi:MAG: nucleoside phosphorylase [Oscillospiraceae bacterium]|nr:nucleoside phosphorylase [Oscillospiraceae bacterium]